MPRSRAMHLKDQWVLLSVPLAMILFRNSRCINVYAVIVRSINQAHRRFASIPSRNTRFGTATAR